MSDISLLFNVLKAFKRGHGKYMVIRASIHWTANVLQQDLEKSQSRKIRIQTPRQQRYGDANQISERYDHYKIQFRVFETSRYLAVRRLTAQRIEVQANAHMRRNTWYLI